DRRCLLEPAESRLAIAEPGISASAVVGGRPGPLVAGDGLAEGLDRLLVAAFVVERQSALVEAGRTEIGEDGARLAVRQVRLRRRGGRVPARFASLLGGPRGGGMHGREQERDGGQADGGDAAGGG